MEGKPEASRENGSARSERFLYKTDSYEFFEGLQQHPEKVKEIPFEEFQAFLTRINGIAREIPIPEREADGDRVYIGGFIGDIQVPRPEDKGALLQKAYESIGKLEHPGDERYMLPAVVNAVHLYADGNGRTSRVLHLLLSPHESEQKLRSDIQQTLDKDGRFTSLNVDPSLIDLEIERAVLKNHGISFTTDSHPRALPPEGFTRLFDINAPQSEKGKEFATLRQRDNWYAFVSAYEYLMETNLLEQVMFENGEACGLSMQKMDKILGDEGWQDVIDSYFKLKKEHVETLVNIFIEPEKYKNSDGTINLRDKFLQQIEEHYQRLKTA